MSSHKGIPVVAAFMLQMPCFPAMLFAWLSTSHLIWVESSSFQRNMAIILPICHSFKHSHANLAEPLANCPCQKKGSWNQKSQMVQGQWHLGELGLVWSVTGALCSCKGRCLCSTSLPSPCFYCSSGTFLGSPSSDSACQPGRKLPLKINVFFFSWVFYWVNEVKLLCAVTCALVCGVVLWDYCRYPQEARNDKTNTLLCDYSDDKFGTADRIFFGVEDRCTF